MAALCAAPGCLGNMRLALRPVWRCRSLRPLSLSPPGTPASPLSSPGTPASPSGLCVRPGFVSPGEEAALCGELEAALRGKRYQGQHWDAAIHGFRETERSQWSPQNAAVLQRVREVAFPPGEGQLSLVHVLDLKKEGYINPHVDSVKFCGSVIAGISLLSDSVMRLVAVDNPGERADVLLPRRCLYVLSGAARYDFTHEILRDEESFFNGERVPRERRISIICRNLPPS